MNIVITDFTIRPFARNLLSSSLSLLIAFYDWWLVYLVWQDAPPSAQYLLAALATSRLKSASISFHYDGKIKTEKGIIPWILRQKGVASVDSLQATVKIVSVSSNISCDKCVGHFSSSSFNKTHNNQRSPSSYQNLSFLTLLLPAFPLLMECEEYLSDWKSARGST